MNLNNIVAISTCRTPMGSFGGTLKNMASYDIGAVAVKAAVERAGLTGDQIDEVILGIRISFDCENGYCAIHRVFKHTDFTKGVSYPCVFSR